MKSITKLFVLSAGVGLAACVPAPVDPHADFTIEGALIGLDGEGDPNATVRVIKIDSWLGQERHILLDYLDESPNAWAEKVFTTTTESDGSFSLELTGAQVNNSDGSGAAYLAVLYQTPSDPDLATITDWHNFTDTNPVWSAGDIKLWNGPTAAADDDVVTFSKNDPPAGNKWDTTWPLFALAYTENNNSPGDYFLEWGGHTYNSSLVVPRAAFTGTEAPGYVMIARSTQNGREMEHRSSYLAVTATDWSDAPIKYNYLDGGGASLLDQKGTPITAKEATDTLLSEPWLEFGFDDTAFYVDLGSVQPITDILVYNLVVSPSLNKATLTIDISSDPDITTADTNSSWQNIQTAGPGTLDLQNWIFLGWTGSESAQLIRIQVDGGGRTLESVAEVEVLAP